MRKLLWIIYILINVYCFYVVASDKRLSEKGNYGSNVKTEQRIAEVSLATYSAFGGSLGTLIGFQVFNHKTSAKKSYLRNNIYALLLLNFIVYLSFFRHFKKSKDPFE